MEKAEIQAMLAQACRMYGVYEVTKLLHQVAKASSEEMLKHGNEGAVVHRDAHILSNTLTNMALAHPLRAGDLK